MRYDTCQRQKTPNCGHSKHDGACLQAVRRSASGRGAVRVTEMKKLAIFDLDDFGLAFDLRDVLRVLAPRSLAATWTIRTPDASSFEATGAGGARLEELADVSAQVGGDELLALADDTVQVIWGDFVGALPDDPNREWLIVRAVDSSFFEIETLDQAALATIESSFKDVRVA